MKLKFWPLLAMVLIGFSLVLHKAYIAKTDFKNAQKTVEKTVSAPIADVAQIHTYPDAPVVAHPERSVQSEKVPSTQTVKSTNSLEVARSQLSNGDDDTGIPPDDTTPVQEQSGALAFILANLTTIVWALVALVEVIVRLTPTEKDNSILSFIVDLLSKIIPNRRTGGGTL